jgi:two-component system, LytTR family, sensor kinase
MNKKNNYKALEFNDLWFRIIGIPILGIIVPIVFFGKSFGINEGFLVNAFFSIAYAAFYWNICRYIFIWGNTQYPKVTQYKQRLSWILGLSLVLILIVCNLFDRFLCPQIIYKPTNLQVNIASFFSFLLIALIYETMRYVMLWKSKSVEYEQLQRQITISQLETLKNQVNPHFLFNSLNTLITIIPENSEKAVGFVKQLSKVYRYILEMKEDNITSLENELEFLDAYIFLLKERFGDNLIINIEDSAHLNNYWYLVPLSLQILLENAIKHNIVSNHKPLTIDIKIENKKLIFKNNFQLKNQVQEGTGIGLQNIQKRYKLLSNEPVEIIKTAEYFIVVLPLFKTQIMD